MAGLAGHALGRAVAHAGLEGLDVGVGQQLDVGAPDAVGAAIDDDGAVHLGQLAQVGGGQLDVEVETPRGYRLNRFIEAEHDNGAGAPAQDPLQPVAQNGPRRYERQGVPEQTAVRFAHQPSLCCAPPMVMPGS